MKKYFLTGFVILCPIAITVMLLLWLFDLLTSPLLDIAKFVLLQIDHTLSFSIEKHAFLALIISRFLVLIFLLGITFLLGFLGNKFFFRLCLRYMNALFTHIPFIKVIYSTSKDMAKLMIKDYREMFKHTCIVPFPYPDSYAIGFVTSPISDKIKPHIPECDLAVFVPTSPHPICGFVLLYPQKLVKPIDVSAEEAFKFIISCGSLSPHTKKTDTSAPNL